MLTNHGYQEIRKFVFLLEILLRILTRILLRLLIGTLTFLIVRLTVNQKQNRLLLSLLLPISCEDYSAAIQIIVLKVASVLLNASV